MSIGLSLHPLYVTVQMCPSLSMNRLLTNAVLWLCVGIVGVGAANFSVSASFFGRPRLTEVDFIYENKRLNQLFFGSICPLASCFFSSGGGAGRYFGFGLSLWI